MTQLDSDLLLRVASQETEALAGIYDRHAAAVYGYALLVTRRPRQAAKILARAIAGLARSPERATTSGGLRRPLLALTRPLARREAERRRLWRRKRRSYALAPDAPAGLRERLDREEPEAAEETALRAIEGLGVREIQDETLPLPPLSDTAPAVAWRPPPASLRALVLLHAAEASQPARRYVRWVLSWGVFAAALVVAIFVESRTPRLPEVDYTPPPESISQERNDALKRRRPVTDLIEALKRAEEGR